MLAERSSIPRRSKRTSSAGALFVLLALGCASSAGPKDAGGKPHHDSGMLDGGSDHADDPDSYLVAMPDAKARDDKPQQNELVVSPSDSTVMISAYQPDSIEFGAALKDGSQSALSVKWTTNHRNVGEIDPDTGVFKPNGAGGVVVVTARAGALSRSVTISVVVSGAVEGDPDYGSLPEGAGGLGGVGGEGPGGKISDAAVREALDKQASADADLVWLYPYDGTVWPRGLPAPLLQWKSATHAAQAVKVHVEVDSAYSVDLYLDRPKKLAADKPIERLPLPQDIWRNALASGKQLKVTLTIVSRDTDNKLQAYVAKLNPSWTIAPATLRGTVYYNSYATNLAQNYSGAIGGIDRFGGATLAIRGGSFDPTLVAGSTTQDDSGCRVCHIVSGDGATLIAQRTANMSSSRYDLRNANAETMYPPADDGRFGWAALSPDGALALGASGPPGSNQQNPSSLATSALYKVSDGTALTAQGLSEFVTQAATPNFSNDAKKIVFNLWSGTGTPNIVADGHSLVVMDFEKVNDTTYAFKNPRAVYRSLTAEQRPSWPFFLPDANGLVFALELQSGTGNEMFMTRSGARSELWWADLEGHSHALDRANGKGYLPSGPNDHDQDTTLQYEPTIAPIVAGGYAWVVFTSRRLYGNVATRGPYESDPRGWDLTPDNANGPTTKKLWVSAIDMPPKAGSDPSHPAFYMPAQELYAGNTRGYWALDACKPDLAECTGGDECCNGFCRRDVENSTGVCMDIPVNECAKEYDKCNVNEDCCAGQDKALYCIGGRCSVLVTPG